MRAGESEDLSSSSSSSDCINEALYLSLAGHGLYDVGLFFTA